jgi:hypothetical protein
MILPNKVKEQALKAEDLIAQERMIVDRINKQLSLYLDDLSTRIQPIINHINAGLKTENLPFEFALEALKNGHAMTNKRILSRGHYITYNLYTDDPLGPKRPDGFFLHIHNHRSFFKKKPSEWTPTTQDLIIDDWCYWDGPLYWENQ